MNLRVVIAVVLLVGGTAGAVLGLRPMLDVGTCASGGPYVIAQECPDDYAWLFWVMFGGLVLAIVGLVMLFFVASFATGFGAMALWLAALGVAALVKARSLEGDSRLGLDIVGWLFVPMGVAGMLLAALIHRAGARRPGPARAGRR